MDNDTKASIAGCGGLTLLAIIGMIGWLLASNLTYSNGVREGLLVKFSERGLFVKNWCGQINVGGLIGVTSKSGTNYIPYVLDFGIDRRIDETAMVNKINSLMGQEVKITYEQKAFGGNAWIGCSDYIVKDISLK